MGERAMKMEDRATKFRKFIERLPRLCSPTICGTLSQPATRAERNNRTPVFEWSLEQKAILSPANITTATSSDAGEVVDHSFLRQESEQFFSQKCIAPSPMTTPSTRYSRSQPVPKNWSDYMFDERDEDTDVDEEEEEDEDEDDEGEDEDEGRKTSNGGNDCSMMSATSNQSDNNQIFTQAPRAARSRRRISKRRDSDTDIDMDVLDDQTDIDTDSERDTSRDRDTDQDDMTDVENDNPDDNNKSDDDDKDDDDDDDNDNNDGGEGGEGARSEQDMDSLFLSPPMRSSQSQQRFDIFSPETFNRVLDDENTLQSTPKTTGAQLFRPRVRRGSDMSD